MITESDARTSLVSRATIFVVCTSDERHPRDMDELDHPHPHCLFFSTNALARALTRVVEDAFAPTGLAPSSAFTMMTVKRRPGIQPSEIATIMRLSPSTAWSRRDC